tara:strand:+ start:102 stop:362 length:261 start_codon:yes stop_codon:yes gene_type:complete
MAEKSQGTKLGGVKNITSSRFYDNCGIGKDVSKTLDLEDEDDEHILHDKHILKNHTDSIRKNELFNGQIKDMPGLYAYDLNRLANS